MRDLKLWFVSGAWISMAILAVQCEMSLLGAQDAAESQSPQAPSVTDGNQDQRTLDEASAIQPPASPAPVEDAKPSLTDDNAGKTPETNSATVPDAVDPVDTLRDQVFESLRRISGVCGAVFGEITAEQLNLTVVVEATAADAPSPEDLTSKLRPLCGDRELKVMTAPWPAAERLGQLRKALKEQQELQDVKVEGIFLQGRTPQSLECQLLGTATNPDSPEKLIPVVAPLVKEFDTPFESALIPVASNIVVPLPDPEPLLLAIQKSIAQSPEFIGLRVERIVPEVGAGHRWELVGESPVPSTDKENLKRVWDAQLALIHPKWLDRLEFVTPNLRQRLPEVAPILAVLQERLAAEAEWAGCQLSGISASTDPSANGDANSNPYVIWTLEGRVVDPEQDRRLEPLCQEVILEVHRWWRRTLSKSEDTTETAPIQLRIQSNCDLTFPSPKALEQQMQALVKSAPEWRGCRVDRIEARGDVAAAGGAASPDHPGARSMSWLLIGEVKSPGQERRLVASAAEQLCRMFPKWNGSARLRIDPEPKLALSPIDPAPLLPLIQDKLSKYNGWGGCSVTGLEQIPCTVEPLPAEDATRTKWQIVGTVAFLAQQRRLPALAIEAFNEVYPGWDDADRPEISANQPQVELRRPTSAALLASLHHDLKRLPDYDDCQIVDARIESAGGESLNPASNQALTGDRLEINLIGCTSRATRRQSFVSLHPLRSFTSLYGPEVTSEPNAELVADPTDLEVVASSEGLASLQFERGQGYFVRRQFEEAKAAFEAAMFEDPANLNYKMWHIAMCLALDEDSLAHDRLLNLLQARRAQFRTGYDFRGVMKSLERLQGPLRNRLAALERQVMSEIAVAHR